jgi:hypothetical protein
MLVEFRRLVSNLRINVDIFFPEFFELIKHHKVIAISVKHHKLDQVFFLRSAIVCNVVVDE